jgi:hypothetical protein
MATMAALLPLNLLLLLMLLPTLIESATIRTV